MDSSTIREYAYNAVFGGVHCDEFYFFTLPALVTIIISCIIFIRAVLKGNAIYKFGDAIELVFGLGIACFAIIFIILYAMDPQEDGVIFNILAFLIMGAYVGIDYLILTTIPFMILSMLLFLSHDIYIGKRYNGNRSKVNRILADRNLSDKERIKELVKILEVNNSQTIATCVDLLQQAVRWKKNEYKGITYYGVYVHYFFKDHRKIYIGMLFDQDYLDIVRRRCESSE